MTTAPPKPAARRNLGNVRKIDFLMAKERDLPERPEGATFRYVLCSTARCGSNLVGQLLHDTGLAGDPHEYLNERYMQGYLRMHPEQKGQLQIGKYLADLERRRTSPNGVFGIKIHFEHLDALSKRNPQAARRLLKRFDKFILLSRRDKLAQAVSLHKARVTQIWSSLDYQFLDEDDPRRKIKAEFDPLLITRALSDLVEQETKWRHVVDKGGLPHAEVFYEDVVADNAGQTRRLLAELGEDAASVDIPPPKLQKQGAENDPMVAQYRRFLGADA